MLMKYMNSREITLREEESTPVDQHTIIEKQLVVTINPNLPFQHVEENWSSTQIQVPSLDLMLEPREDQGEGAECEMQHTYGMDDSSDESLVST